VPQPTVECADLRDDGHSSDQRTSSPALRCSAQAATRRGPPP